MTMDKHATCPVETTLRVIGGKWKAVILWYLHERVLRFGELKRSIPGVTQRMLTQQLRELEDDGVIVRKVFAEVPPKVEYSISDLGLSLVPILKLMCRWGTEHQKRAPRARRAAPKKGMAPVKIAA
jgi:DNA-binding HxlR family transcriptional regulator